jgi:hypothetical protein
MCCSGIIDEYLKSSKYLISYNLTIPVVMESIRYNDANFIHLNSNFLIYLFILCLIL